jgi:hypothetical protein
MQDRVRGREERMPEVERELTSQSRSDQHPKRACDRPERERVRERLLEWILSIVRRAAGHLTQRTLERGSCIVRARTTGSTQPFAQRSIPAYRGGLA